LEKNARAWALNFDWKVAAKEYLKLYEEVANGKRW
jgi:glycosyltransferase involved in cell wall biosynthesis